MRWAGIVEGTGGRWGLGAWIRGSGGSRSFLPRAATDVAGTKRSAAPGALLVPLGVLLHRRVDVGLRSAGGVGQAGGMICRLRWMAVGRRLGWCLALASVMGAGCASRSESARGITHRFLAFGAETRLVEADGRVSWSYPLSTRDGWMLEGGSKLLTVSRGERYPGGGVVEVNGEGQTVFEWRGTQEEVNTAQRLANGNTLVTEAGPRPRILELDRAGRIVVEVPIQCQLTNVHMQSRMTRKLPNGNYLVPQLLDRVVREYRPDGKVAWEVSTPHWPFTAIRLPDGNTLIGCTYGNLVIEVDRSGRVVWQVSNDDLPGDPIRDACGVQRLPNGNTVITSYGAREQPIKLMEVTRDKRVVWTYESASTAGIHHFQVLETNGRAVRGAPMR